MRAGPGPGLANACGQPRGTYIMLPGPPRATVAPVCDCQLCQLPGVRTLLFEGEQVELALQDVEQLLGVAVQVGAHVKARPRCTLPRTSTRPLSTCRPP